MGQSRGVGSAGAELSALQLFAIAGVIFDLAIIVIFAVYKVCSLIYLEVTRDSRN